MIIIGEKINSSFKTIRSAIETYDTAVIQDMARRQYDAGSTFIDVNAGMFSDDEPEKIGWLIRTIQEVIDAPFSIDSLNPKALLKGLQENKNGKPIINSITNEKERYETVLPLVLEYNASVIALCTDDAGMPETVDDRVEIADKLVSKLTKKGIALEDIYIDPLVRPVGSGSHYGIIAIESIRKIKREFPQIHIACGLSNISFGIPARKLMNQAFLVAAMAAGMDGTIMDPLDRKLMSLIYASEALLGLDSFCMNYMMKFREGLLED